MFTENEIKTVLNNTNNYVNKNKDIKFSIGVDDYELQSCGLLTLLLNDVNYKKEYHAKITTVDELKYAVEHLDEWIDDWN